MENIEVERKFLVDHSIWKKVKKPRGQLYIQGYLCIDENMTIRVRIAGAFGFITIKGKSVNFSRPEFEYPIPVAEAKEILRLFTKNLIEKTRFKIAYKKYLWEVDEFHGENTGLILAEIELRGENDVFERPNWVGVEVTGNQRYNNSYLYLHPYEAWANKKPGGK